MLLIRASLSLLFFFSVVRASWFSAEREYANWSPTELRAWLEHRNIHVPAHFSKSHLYDLVHANWNIQSNEYAEAGRQWTLDQYNKAQRVFQHVKQLDTLDNWDESRLRGFLLELGVVAPSGPREQLVLLAKKKHRSYSDAAALYSSIASASSVYEQATDTIHAASQSISNTVAQATHEVTRTFDETKDYIHSAWDDNRIRSWLEEHGVLEARKANTRHQLTDLIKDHYRKTNTVVWDTWSDSYIREWLIAHKLLKPSDSLSRSTLLAEMKKYYYDCSDKVWNTWSDSELKAWLVEHDLIKSDAQKKRDELVKMLEEHYASAADSVWGAWNDSAIRQWLVENGHLEESSALQSRKELVHMINKKYTNASEKTAAYLVWPDARLRAYLRERGVSESALPTDRPALLQEARIRWVQTSTKLETMFARLKEIVNNSVEAVEERLARAVDILSGHSHESAHTWGWGSNPVNQAREKAFEASEFAEKQGLHCDEGSAKGKDEL